MNRATANIKICNDVSIHVPNSLQLMTPYVLLEQNDWFEDEIKFLRSIIKPGMNVIDIGANYGVYTLAIAKLIGDSGKIWAFEPTSFTADCLRKSIAENKFNNTELIQAGLSDRMGKAKFYTVANSELNSLHKGSVRGENSETILLLTLDHCKKKYKWTDIDFIKLDAEGEEGNILKKGEETLLSLSPLIMYELKHGDKINIPLINLFKKYNYASYRLIPGLNILIPFNPDEPYDGYQLNLFCCKEDKAKQLENEGVIVSGWDHIEIDNKGKLSNTCLALFGKESVHNLQGPTAKYNRVINSYLLSISPEIKSRERVGYLLTALKQMKIIIDSGEDNIEKLSTFARLAFEAGERTLGVKILAQLIKKYQGTLNFDVKEPVLPPCPRYDKVIPNADNVQKWLFSSILEQYIEKHAFSTYFTRLATISLFEQLGKLGFMSQNMQQRRELMLKSFTT